MLELVYIILLFVLPMISIVLSIINLKYSSSLIGFFAGSLLIPAMVIITALIK